MIELLPDMPEGTIGLRPTGRLTKRDFEEIEPTLRRAVEDGDVRLVEVIGPDYEGLEAGALFEDVRFGLEVLVGHRSALTRLAIVTNTEWIIRAIHAFAWLIPGELRIFPLDELEEAKTWAAG